MSPDVSIGSLPQPLGNSWNWILQPWGKTLEWMGHILASESTDYSPFLHSYIYISINRSKKQTAMQLNSVTKEDTVNYYCATHTVRGLHCVSRHKLPHRDSLEHQKCYGYTDTRAISKRRALRCMNILSWACVSYNKLLFWSHQAKQV
jgi:hypothetical protein